MREFDIVEGNLEAPPEGKLRLYATKDGLVSCDANGNKVGPLGTGGTASYSSYVAVLTQSGEDAPVATVLENTIGAIVWTRTSAGSYSGTLASAFPSGRTIVLPGSYTIAAIGGQWAGTIMCVPQDNNSIFIQAISLDGVSDDAFPVDGMPIEIRVYPGE